MCSGYQPEESQFFRAPSNIEESEATCYGCGKPILPGELITDFPPDQLCHERCTEDEQ